MNFFTIEIISRSNVTKVDGKVSTHLSADDQSSSLPGQSINALCEPVSRHRWLPVSLIQYESVAKLVEMCERFRGRADGVTLANFSTVVWSIDSPQTAENPDWLSMSGDLVNYGTLYDDVPETDRTWTCV